MDELKKIREVLIDENVQDSLRWALGAPEGMKFRILGDAVRKIIAVIDNFESQQLK